MDDPDRRALLSGVGVLAASLAGCATRSGVDGTVTTTRSRAADTATDQPADTDTVEPSATPTHEAVRWRHTVGSPVRTVAAADDRAYVGTEDHIVAIRADDGDARWAVETDDPVQDIVVERDRVFAVVGSYALGSEHTLVGLAAGDGTERWRRTPTNWWLELLGVRDGTVYAATTDDALGPDGQALYALSAAEGRVRWEADVGDTYGGLLTDRAVYVPAYGRLYAVGHGGDPLWTRDLTCNANSMSVVGDTVAFSGETDSSRYVGFGLAACDGTTRWTVDDRYVNSTRAGDGVVYVGGEHVLALDPASGREHWRDETGGSLYDTPLSNGTLYATREEVRALSTADGSVRWTSALDLYLPDAVALLDGTVYVHASRSRDDRNRHLAAVDDADGTERWRFVASAPLTDPVVVGGRLVAGSEAGAVYGFE